MADLPADWQARFVDQVRGVAPGEARWFAGGPRLDPGQQLAVYQRQYELRLVGAVRDEVPGLAWALGDDADEVLAACLEDHPSRSWSLNHVADALPAWLEARGAPVAQVDLARVDLAVQRGFDAADSPPLDPAALVSAPRLAVAPSVSLLALRTNAHHVRSAVVSGQPVVDPIAERHWVVIHRVDRRMRHWGAPAGAFALLEAFREGLGLGPALDHVFARGLLDPERAAADVEAWFAAFARKGLVYVP